MLRGNRDYLKTVMESQSKCIPLIRKDHLEEKTKQNKNAEGSKMAKQQEKRITKSKKASFK